MRQQKRYLIWQPVFFFYIQCKKKSKILHSRIRQCKFFRQCKKKSTRITNFLFKMSRKWREIVKRGIQSSKFSPAAHQCSKTFQFNKNSVGWFFLHSEKSNQKTLLITILFVNGTASHKPNKNIWLYGKREYKSPAMRWFWK